MAKPENNFLVFSLDQDHVYRMFGSDWGLAYTSNGTVTFYAIGNPGQKANYDYETLNRLNASGQIEVQPYAQLPEHLRPVQGNTLDDVFLSGVNPAKRKRAEGRHAMVQAYLALRDQGVLKAVDSQIEAFMPRIREEAEVYLAENLPDPEYDLKVNAWKNGTGRKPRSKGMVTLPDKVSASQLRKWASAFKKGGKKALLDNIDKRGNHNSYFTTDEMALLAKVVNSEYMNRQNKKQSVVLADVKAAFEKENQRREKEGEVKLRVPGRDALRQFIKGLDKFQVLVARRGHEEAMKKMRPTNKGLEVLRPFERVEMDEWKIDLLTILAASGLLAMFSAEEQEKMGFDGSLMRWWLVGAVDCRSSCFVGLILTPNPKASGAIKCLRMVVSDKGQFADKIGALAPWSMFGTPETLYVDNGSAFKSALFTNVCADLGITKVQTIAGQPSMRGKIERTFRTLGTSFLSRLSGRTFGNVVERGTHPSEELACHAVEDLIYALVRWVVDVYHNTPQEALNGRTPLEQWETDLKDENYPLMSAPTQRRKRIAFGLPLERVVQKDGIRILNVRYQSGDLAAWYLKNGNITLNVRWFEENIGTVEVELDGEWQPVPAVSETFEGVDASTWVATRRALRARDQKRVEWEEGVIAQAIADIEALNAMRKTESRIIDHGWDEKRFKAVNKEAMASFDVVPNTEKFAGSADGYGRSVTPVPQPKPSAVKETNLDSAQSGADEEFWTFRD
ncbi:Mu transposase C-terminal domain-containing protein [uncultured Pelagimonas sp.]|uniref:Mu transposase C-terminal domain-containing protein n=1 Tax=uncultured Pelagimonas sp. TaxID=1618102 RepID=UPI0026235FE4|nr:Mu transposase C-terminal domain-containing protein [uncultured Pelagimonas sp.]